jgi:hypothetical protein
LEGTVNGKIWSGISCLLLAGCVSTGNSELANEATIMQIKVGETTRRQVASLLGEPTSQRTIEMAGATREWWTYSYASSTINPLEYLFLYGIFFNGIGLPDARHDLSLFFDHRGIVGSLSRLKTDYEMGGPLSPLQATSISIKTMGFTETSKEPIRFEDRMEYRY